MGLIIFIVVIPMFSMYTQIGQWILSLFEVISIKASSATTEITFSNATVVSSSATTVLSSLT